MKSFGQQIAQLFSFAGYKTNAKLIPCLVTTIPFSQQPRLSYKCDIALQIYNYYKKYGFKFSQKGVTPKLIAQEIDIYVNKSNDYSARIDSFGNFIITPTDQYFDKLQQKSIDKNVVKHEQIISLGIQNKWHSNNKKIIYYEANPLNLSTLRIINYLTILKKKYEVFHEYLQEQIIPVLNANRLSQNDIDLLMKLNFIGKTTKILNSSHLTTASLIKIGQLHIGPKDEVVTGTLRHQYIPFQSRHKDILGVNPQILTFGEIFPNLQIHQLHRIDSTAISAILTKSLQITTNFLINFKQSVVKKQPTQLLDGLKNRSNQQKLLILLQYVQQDKLIDLINLNIQNITKKQYKPFITLKKQLNMIL